MNLTSKTKAEILLVLLFVESVILSFVIERQAFFWFFFILSAFTALVYGLYALEILPNEFRNHERRNDVLLVTAMTAVLNANIAVFSNRVFVFFIFGGYYLGLRYLTGMFREGPVNQIQKNALNLSVLLSVFLGANLTINIFISFENVVGPIALPMASVAMFVLIYLLSYYNFLKNRISMSWSKTYSVILSLVMLEIFLLGGYFIEKYPSIYKSDNLAGAAITTTSLFMIVIYYLVHGLMIHKLTKKFDYKIIFEYISISMIILATLFLTIKWLPS